MRSIAFPHPITLGRCREIIDGPGPVNEIHWRLKLPTERLPLFPLLDGVKKYFRRSAL
jgi:hypothetical protein